MDILMQLSREHDTLRTLLERVEAAVDRRDAAAVATHLEAATDALTSELDAHIGMEEAEALSPIAKTLGAALVAPFYEEHVEIRAIRDQVYERLARGETPYEQAFRLCDLILSHQQREDLMLFPSARDAAIW